MLVKITHLSDTHGVHGKCKTNGGDILIHTGDIFDYQNKISEESIIDWFDKQPYQLKLIVQGNHDNFSNYAYGNIKILQDELIELCGIKIYGGSCVLPEKSSKKYNVDSEEFINNKLFKNKQKIDILCTHGAPKGILDIKFGKSIGSVSLLNYVLKYKPLLHLFGHCHHKIGLREINGTTFINNSIVYNCIKLNIQSKPLDIKLKI
jgi:Icc-related predicted phosphoesterase